MSATTQTTTPEADASALALVVFGRDEAGKPHASAFDSSEADLAEKAAGLMGMHVLRVETDEQRDLAAKLPRGRVFASGRAFVPFVKAGLYEALAALVQPENEQAPPSWEAITLGSVVLATTGPMDGWYEAVVIQAKGEDLFTLRWRDYPDEGTVVRRRKHLALLHPGGSPA